MILGIDPGFAITGFAALQGENRLADCGVIRTSAGLPFEERLSVIRTGILHLLDQHRPQSCSIEKVFFANNKKTALEVAHARGVIMEALHSRAVPIFEYSPPQVKKSITGNGQASKADIQTMIKKIYGLKEIIEQDDACDAVAIALCHRDSMLHGREELKGVALSRR